MDRLFLFIVILFSFTMTNCNKEDVPQRVPPEPVPEPIADFIITNDSCDCPCIVSFRNTSKNAKSYLWEYGSGPDSTDGNPSHLYSSPGTYNVSLTATGWQGYQSYKHKTVTINNPYFFRVKIDGNLFNASSFSGSRNTSVSPRIMSVSGYTNGDGPGFNIALQESFMGFSDGIQGTFNSSSYPLAYMTYTDISGKTYSTQYDSNGVSILFSKLSYSNGGAVEATQTSFSGTMSSSTGSQIVISEGNFKLSFSN